ncbi:MAG: ribbon-helix-helix domain-containing protein [Dehalococcoidia bacterium]
MRSKKHYPPSRLRYEQGNPVVSIRVSKEVYGRLKELKERSGKSVGDVLREALGKQDPTAKAAYSRGYKKGWAEAEHRYRVDYPCRKCYGTLTILLDKEKQAAATFMIQGGWVHSACPQQ